MNDEKYDSYNDTANHIRRVQSLITDMVAQLVMRRINHDQSKLHAPEKEIFDIYTPKLKGTTYGSEEYKQYLSEMQVALKHHYENNQHHPEHFKNGVNEMSLIDLIEMICDWKAATERHADGSIVASLAINKKRFGISDQLIQVMENTCKSMDWIP